MIISNYFIDIATMQKLPTMVVMVLVAEAKPKRSRMKRKLHVRFCNRGGESDFPIDSTSCCGYRWGKLDLSVRSVLCLNCGTQQDRDENAAKNIEMVGMGHRHDLKCTSRDCKTTSVAKPNEA
jgi:hypothetical protein